MQTFGQEIDFIYNMLQNCFSTNKMTKDKEFSLTRTMVERWYNTAYTRFMTQARVLNEYTSITCASATSTYTMASNIDSIVEIWFQKGTGSKYRLQSLTSDHRAYYETMVGQPLKYETYKDSSGNRILKVYPSSTITTADTIHLKVILQPTALTNDSDVPLIPNGYDFAVSNAVISQGQLYCGLTGDDKINPIQFAQIYQQKLDADAAQCLSDEENYTNYDYQFRIPAEDDNDLTNY